MREHRIPCKELCGRWTWRDDGYCVQHTPTSVGAAVSLPLTGSGDASIPPDASPHLLEPKETR